MTMTVVGWIDIFTRNEHKEILIESLKHCQKEKGLIIFAWCLMTNHIHLIIASEGTRPERIIRDLKKHTSREFKAHLMHNPRESRRRWLVKILMEAGRRNSNNLDWQFWQQHNQPMELCTNGDKDRVLNYIHQNPVVAGFVDQAEHWVYSSARDYFGMRGLLEISFL